MAGAVSGMIANNWSKTPRSITLSFLAGFAALSTLMAVAATSGYFGKLYVRDHGVKSFGVVTGKHEIDGRRTSYYLDYSYTPVGAGRSIEKNFISENHEVSREIYDNYSVGVRVPIKCDPKNTRNSHLDVQGYWSNSRLALSSILEFMICELYMGVTFGVFWLLAGTVHRMFFAPAAAGAVTAK